MKTLLPLLIALAAVGAAPAAEGADHHDQKPAANAEVEHATVTGTVTALDTARKSITLKDDATGESDEYRAYFRGGHAEEIVKKLMALKVGERVTIVYTENEGRRVLTLEPAKGKDAK